MSSESLLVAEEAEARPVLFVSAELWQLPYRPTPHTELSP